MSAEQLKTLKEVADQLDQPPHRIIHVCETGMVRPAVAAGGRGSVRRFSREDIFRIRLALELQDMGVQVPLIKPLMKALDQFMAIYEVQTLQAKLPHFNLVSVLDEISTSLKPMRAYLRPPGRVALLVPGFQVTSPHGLPLRLFADESQLDWPSVTIVANLTLVAAGL